MKRKQYNPAQLALIALIETADAPLFSGVTPEQKSAAEAKLVSDGIVDTDGQFIRTGASAETLEVFAYFL